MICWYIGHEYTIQEQNVALLVEETIPNWSDAKESTNASPK